MRKTGFDRIIFMALILCFPVMAGWQKVELNELITAGKITLEAPVVSPAAVKVENANPYKILENVSTALFQLKNLEVETEVWLENAFFHIKTNFKNLVRNVDEYKADGRVSLSLLLPNGLSTSQWVQTFEIGGIPFTWNREKRVWEKKELEITGKDAKAVLSYSVLRSLFTVNEKEVDPKTVKILSKEKRNGKDCFVLGYSLDPEMFRRWNLVGNISMKLWVSQDDFLPQMLRAEGKIGEMYLLQIVNYSNFNRAAEIVLPQAVSSEVKTQKDALKAKINGLAEEVSRIRGWAPLEVLKVEFTDRVTLRKQLEAITDRDYSEGRLEKEGIVFRWLGLLPDHADYKQSLINSQIASLAGLYDPKLKTIFVGDWIHPAFAEPVIVHEIAHAFQDRQVSMEEFQGDKAEKEDLDFSTARHSLLEGEAVAIMLEYILRKDGKDFQGLGDIFALIEDKIVKNSEYDRKNLLYNIYGYGANFIQYYLKDNKWTELDKIYASAPSSMNNLLHPYRLFGANKPIQKPVKEQVLALPQLPETWKRIYTNRLGEFYLLVSLSQFLEKDTAEQAASGWKNDSVAIYENKLAQRLLISRTKWNDHEGMLSYSAAYKDWLKKRYPQVAQVNIIDNGLIKTPEGLYFLKPDRDEFTVIWSEGAGPEEFAALTEKLAY
jgi:hypothetical protein